MLLDSSRFQIGKLVCTPLVCTRMSGERLILALPARTPEDFADRGDDAAHGLGGQAEPGFLSKAYQRMRLGAM